jgi:hypothetical protein
MSDAEIYPYRAVNVKGTERNVLRTLNCSQLLNEPLWTFPVPIFFLSSNEGRVENTEKVNFCHYVKWGRDSSVGIATGYLLDGPGIESRWGRDFSHTSRPALGPTQPPVQWVQVACFFDKGKRHLRSSMQAKQSVISQWPDLKEYWVTEQVEAASNSPCIFPEKESCSLTSVYIL